MQQRRDPNEIFRMAVTALQAGKAAEAERHCRDLLERVPGQPNALQILGLARFEQKDYVAAADHLEAALVSLPKAPDIHLQLGNAVAERRQYSRALTLFDKALALKPDYPEACFNKGRVLEKLARLEEAREALLEALDLRPGYTAAVLNLSNVLKQLGRFDEAIDICRQALAAQPKQPGLLNNLGNLLADTGDAEGAEEAYRQAVTLAPDYTQAVSNLGQILLEQGRHEEALDHFRKADTVYTRGKAIECLAHLGRWEDFDRLAASIAKREPRNLLVAATCAYVAHARGTKNPFSFCPSPLDFVSVYENYGEPETADALVASVKREILSRDTIWEPRTSSTKGGYQTSDNLFDNAEGPLRQLELTIRDRIADYVKSRAGSETRLIRDWPEKFRLRGWFVRLMTGGHQASHIHPDGWLSGVTYLDLPEGETPPAGGIEFGLYCESYPVLDDGAGPKLQHMPRIGDLVLFPSNLYHRTIPFDSDQERLSLAFDVVPER